MSPYIGKDGEPISLEDALQVLEEDARVALDEIRGHLVSTVWLMVFYGLPLPQFETMIFCRHEGDCTFDEHEERYPTEAAARAGHDRACAMARDAKCGTDGAPAA